MLFKMRQWRIGNLHEKIGLLFREVRSFLSGFYVSFLIGADLRCI